MQISTDQKTLTRQFRHTLMSEGLELIHFVSFLQEVALLIKGTDKTLKIHNLKESQDCNYKHYTKLLCKKKIRISCRCIT